MYPADMSTLTPTARVILGMLALGARTGYDIKRAIDLSTKFFWGASYGQIYPELHRLEKRGLVEATPDPKNGRRRTSYALTAEGRTALRDWLRDDSQLFFETRDEATLKLFFGDLLEREDVIATLRAKRAWCEHALQLFRTIEPQARTGFFTDEQLYPYVSLLYGLELLEWMRDWCERTARRIEAGELPPEPRQAANG
jgi:PadR family transcriptional regulator, regulatory protein AphA